MNSLTNSLARLDAWLEDGEGGVVPLELLRQRGVAIPDPATLADEALTPVLWTLLEAMAEIGLYVSFTDHLTDRELYERLLTDTLLAEAFLDPDDPHAGEFCDLSEGEDRPPVVDRDQHLPTLEGRLEKSR